MDCVSSHLMLLLKYTFNMLICFTYIAPLKSTAVWCFNSSSQLDLEGFPVYSWGLCYTHRHSHTAVVIYCYFLLCEIPTELLNWNWGMMVYYITWNFTWGGESRTRIPAQNAGQKVNLENQESKHLAQYLHLLYRLMLPSLSADTKLLTLFGNKLRVTLIHDLLLMLLSKLSVGGISHYCSSLH